MNYESERRSLEDLKQQARQQSQAAGKVVPCVTVTEKNWAALLSLQQTQLQLLEQVLEAQATLATRWQMEEFLQSQTEELTDCAQKSQAALQSFQSSLKESAKEAEKKLSIQAGRISDQFSSKLSSSQKNLDSHAKGLFWISLIPTALLVLLEVMRHICRNVVKVTGEDIIVKEPKTAAGDRYVYFSLEMASLLKEYRSFCQGELELHEGRELTTEDYVFRRHGENLPMTPSTFTWRFKLILKKHGLPLDLNVHSLRHTAASLMISGGADVATVSGILGHAQVSTTLDIYTHAFDEKKREVSAQMQGRVGV